MTKHSLQKNNHKSCVDPFRDITEVYSIINGDSASSFATSDNDLFLSEFVNYCTDIHSSVDHRISDTYVSSGWACHLPQKLAMNIAMHSE